MPNRQDCRFAQPEAAPKGCDTRMCRGTPANRLTKLEMLIHPGDRHADILFGLLEAAGTAGNLTTDAHLAALAIEHQAELHSTDADMARFPGLRWVNPRA